MLRTSLALAATIAVLAPAPTTARDAMPGGWSISVGAAVLGTPAYEGADRMRALAVPFFDVRFRDLFFASFARGIGLNLLSRDVVGTGIEGLSAGPVLRWRFGRDQDADPALRGLGDIGFAGEAGVYVAYSFMNAFRVRAEVRRGFGGHEGIVADAGLDVLFRLSDTVTASAGPTISWSNARFNQTYFGVTPAQAALSGYAVYTPGDGLRSVGLSGTVNWAVTERVGFTAFGAYTRLGDVAADAPFVARAGSPNQISIGTALTWRLAP